MRDYYEPEKQNEAGIIVAVCIFLAAALILTAVLLRKVGVML